MLTVSVIVASCGGRNTDSYTEAPGGKQSAKDKTLEIGAHLLQNKEPVQALGVYLNGFHFYNGNMGAQMEAHHYVAQLNQDVYQAVIFDGNKADAKLMGVEYIITETLFATLPEEEKHLWHSHRYEVSSGQLIAPGIPKVAEKELMEKLVNTYGKTIHTWHTDQDRDLPIGTPMLMMGFTEDGQADASMIDDRNKRFGLEVDEIKDHRKDIRAVRADPEADAWQQGIIRQFAISDKADSAAHKTHVHR